MDGYRPASYGDAFADVYDDWYADVSAPEATASFLAARVRGPVVELGSGTGRLAGALRRAGVPVVGLDASTAMLRRSRDQEPAVPVVAADMAAAPVRRGGAGGVLVAFNTLFNLPTPELQRAAMTGAAALVRDDGIVVVEAFVPGEGADERSDHVDVARLLADGVVLRVSRTEPDTDTDTEAGTGTVRGHHIELRDGAPVRVRPWHLRYTSPAGLDRLAASCGLVLDERVGSWDGSAFDDTSTVHVSVYRRSRTHR